MAHKYRIISELYGIEVLMLAQATPVLEISIFWYCYHPSYTDRQSTTFPGELAHRTIIEWMRKLSTRGYKTQFQHL